MRKQRKKTKEKCKLPLTLPSVAVPRRKTEGDAGKTKGTKELNEDEEHEGEKGRQVSARLKDEKTKRKNGGGGRAGAVVDGGLLRRSLQLRRRAKKRESREGLVRGRRVNGGRRRKMKKKMRGRSAVL